MTFGRIKMTLRELLKALNQVAIEYEDVLDKPIVIDFDPQEGGYYCLTPVDVVRSFHTTKTVIIATE